jgi:kumamolisin
MFKRGYSCLCFLSLIAGLSLFLTASAANAHNQNSDETDVNGSGAIVGYHGAEEHGIGGFEIKPMSSLPKAEDGNLRAHTQMRILVPANSEVVPTSHDEALRHASRGNHQGVTPDFNPSNNPNQNTPASIACLYNLVAQRAGQPAGCNPLYTSNNPTGGGGAIAIVDAYDDASAVNNLAVFSNYFGLPQANFWWVYAGTTPPYTNGPRPRSGVSSGWNIEEDLDIEWAHAMAPHAKIFLVEAQDDSFNSLLYAIAAAEYIVANNGGGEVSMSWGEGEFQSQLSYDYYLSPSFAPSNVVFLAASGDEDNIVSYPASSPYVIGVGGTSINRSGIGTFASETAWSNTGGGVSAIESRPSFQNSSLVTRTVGNRRGVPDVSLDANPNTGVAVYTGGRWGTVGGTSVATPIVAGIINSADTTRGFVSSTTELQRLYGMIGNNAYLRDVSSGGCGRDSSFVGYDLCTGLGSVLTYIGK